MQLNRKHVIRTALIVAVFLICLIYPAQLFAAFTALYQVSLPLIIGGTLAYCINLLSMRLEHIFWPHAKNKAANALRRPMAILISLLLIILIITGVLGLILPQFISAINGFFTSLPKTIDQLNQWLKQSDQAALLTNQLSDAQIDWTSIQKKVMRYASSGVSGLFSSSISLFGSLISGVFNFVLAFIFALYLVSGKERIGNRLERVGNAFLPAKFMRNCRYVLHEANLMFSSFIIGQVLEAFILGTLCALGMWVFRFPNAVSIGALIGMTALIPMVGAFIGGTVGFVLIAVSNPLQAVLFVVYLICLQQIEGNLIYPRVVGGSIGLPGIVVLTAITVGSGLGGVVGMLLGVPIAATAYRLIRNATWRKEGKTIKD
ncbi:membrane protein [Ligilactobacillus salitolerans]|uniref:Membrane protein n=1 Tax=Ligilactobacillus salitolerans TaxID=1808352 RepID=A0A401IPX1_9LACO|nr:AI-2E family transporter [Ligilactobacillus salitolerans]GBG93588.1 membrane protein [Ligilactobacillus salitolerans]